MALSFTYKYYDTPEGQDILPKTIALSRIVGASAAIMATFDVLLYSHPKGIINTTGRFLYWTGPMLGMATAFTVTTNVAQNIRGKNDGFNYFLGGAMAGSVFGAWQRSLTIGVPAAVVLGLAGVVKKMSVDQGWVFFPEVRHSTQRANTAREDWTMAPDYPKGWRVG